jgi:hypothetical protein
MFVFYPDDCELDDCELCGRKSNDDDGLLLGVFKRPVGAWDVAIVELDCVRLYD